MEDGDAQKLAFFGRQQRALAVSRRDAGAPLSKEQGGVEFFKYHITYRHWGKRKGGVARAFL